MVAEVVAGGLTNPESEFEYSEHVAQNSDWISPDS